MIKTFKAEELKRRWRNLKDFHEKLDAVRIEVGLHERPRLLHQRLRLVRVHSDLWEEAARESVGGSRKKSKQLKAQERLRKAEGKMARTRRRKVLLEIKKCASFQQARFHHYEK